MRKKKKAKAVVSGAFQPTVSDEFIRGCGFRIHSRDKGAEPVWSRNGRTYSQSEAEMLASAETELARNSEI